MVGDECLIEPEAYLSAGVKVYPFKTIEAGAVVNASVIWESRGQRTLFGPRGVSGLVNVEITPELCVRLASAYATTLKKGSVVTTSRDVSRAARALKRAVHSALNASAINVSDLEAQPLPVARYETARGECSAGIALRTTPGDPESIDILFLDSQGAEVSMAQRRRIERVFSRQEYRRAFPGEIAELTYPPRVRESYARDLLQCVDMSGVADAGMKVVVDCAGGTVSLVLPVLLGQIGMDVLTVNNQLDERTPTQSLAQTRAGLQRLADLVASSRADFGVRFDPVGERIMLVDDKGGMISDDRALLVVLDLIAAERRKGRVVLPVTTTRVADQVSEYHKVTVDADDHLTGRAGPGHGRRRRDLRGGRPGRVHRAGVQPDHRRHRGVRPAARPGRQDPAHAQPDRRQDPGRAPAQAVHADPLGGQGQRDADAGGGGRRAGRGHHRRGAGDRAGRLLGAGPARPVRCGHPPVGRGLGSGQHPCASGRMGGYRRQRRSLTRLA